MIRFRKMVCILGDALGGLLAYDILVKQRICSLSRNPSQMSARSDLTDVSVPIPEDEHLDGSCSAFRSESEDQSLANGHNAACQKQQAPNGDSSPGLFQNGPCSLSGTSSQYLSASVGVQPGSISKQIAHRHLSAPESSAGSTPPRGRSMSAETEGNTAGSSCRRYYRKSKLDFRVSSMFLIGSPLGLVLAHRKVTRRPVLSDGTEYITRGPECNHVCNLYYAIDPSCARIEPLLCHGFSRLPPVNVPRYSRFPLGDGQSLHLLDCIQRNYEELMASMRTEGPAELEPGRKQSSFSTSSEQEGAWGATVSCFQNLTGKWWGSRRLDFALYCPEGLATLPKVALPNLLHASFWENSDVAAFIMRQFVTGDDFTSGQQDSGKFGSTLSVSATLFSPIGPTEKWSRKRTSFKIKNATANHRANDIVVTEFQPQVLHARFMYGPLDVVALSGEKVDIYIKTETEATGKLGDWVNFGTESTDNHGRLTYCMPEVKHLPLGLYPVKMVVRGDHTYLDMFLAVVPPQTECVVFSIDGSFTASMSVTGKDPKVRPGAVDVVRHWQDLGYLILYITARPDMQQKRVISWLAQHNFPHGLLFFTDGISTDPLKQKTQYLKQLVDQRQVKFQAGYGSSKDIHVYSAAGVPSQHTFVIGKVSKKLQSQSQVLTEGYSIHLSQLTSGSLQSVGRPARGNGRLLIRKGCFSLPGQYRSVTVQRSQSFTPRTGKYDSHPAVSSMAPDTAGTGKQKRHMSPFRMISRSSAKGKEKFEGDTSK